MIIKRPNKNDCEKATLLIEKMQFDRITLEEAQDLKLHLSGCDECRIYLTQSELINVACRKVFSSNQYISQQLDGNFKNALQSLVEKKIRNI